jgi:hypothetical protein
MTEPKPPKPPQPPYLRISCPTGFAHEAQVRVVGEDGHETPVEAAIRSIVVKMDNKDPWATATIEFEGVQLDLTATPADVEGTRRAVNFEYQRALADLDSLTPCPDSPASPDA